MFSKFMYYTGLVAAVAIIGCCFLPWVHYNSINTTFTGYNVTKFATGNYYGRAGVPITILSVIVLVLMLLPYLWAKRTNLFMSALLFAYCIRTYIIFTSALFAGEVEKQIGIYLIVLLSFMMLLASLFPKGEATKY
ncbi:MAG: hypothetical protein ABIN36_14185 [Ferruginibacter sp.]